jgi:hypothetical protein
LNYIAKLLLIALDPQCEIHAMMDQQTENSCKDDQAATTDFQDTGNQPNGTSPVVERTKFRAFCGEISVGDQTLKPVSQSQRLSRSMDCTGWKILRFQSGTVISHSFRRAMPSLVSGRGKE